MNPCETENAMLKAALRDVARRLGRWEAEGDEALHEVGAAMERARDALKLTAEGWPAKDPEVHDA